MKVKSLDKKWKEFLFGFSGFGPNFLMVLMGAFFTDAVNPVAISNSEPFQAIVSGVCFISPAVFPILYAIAKALDGIIDIPFAHVTDTLSTKWGRRRPTIFACLIPMIVSFAMCWWPVGGENHPIINTVWILFWALVFFATYTLAMISYYGSLSTTCSDEPQRLRVSGYKSFFDTISYCLVYALVPLILSGAQIHIDKFVFMCLPLMLTLLIPLFLIKEGEKYGYPENDGLQEEKISIGESMKLTFKNKIFMRWEAVNCCTYFGLQMFLVGMNALIIGGMGMSGGEMAILNTCAFAPVPVMLYLFNKLKAKKGIRFTYQTCLISFAVSIMSFFFGSNFFMGLVGGTKLVQIIIGCIGGLFGSWAIGAFFMMPYHVTAQVSAVEEKLTKKNHSAMYFAANCVFTSVVGAISGSIVYENIKMLFFSTTGGGIMWAESYNHAAFEAGVINAEQLAFLLEYAKMSVAERTPEIIAQAKALQNLVNANIFNFGTALVPFIVSLFCILGAVLASKMPKDYTPKLVAEEFKKHDPSLDISVIENDPSYNVKEEKSEIIFVQLGLSVLSGFIFGFIWVPLLFKSIKEQTKNFKNVLFAILSCVVPFFGIYSSLQALKALKAKADEMGLDILSGKKYIGHMVALIVSGVCLPLLPINVVTLALLQNNVNKIYEAEDKAEEAVAETVAVEA